MAIKAEKTFSLKDDLFNEASVDIFAAGLERAWNDFPGTAYRAAVLSEFPRLELKQRIQYMVETLAGVLPDDFDQCLEILRAALPAPLDPNKTDDDFGQFVWTIPGDFVASYGLERRNVKKSLAFLKESTKRFTAEGSIRPFLREYPKETLAFVHRCAVDKNYHVRRLASEGIRPYLPWAERVVLPLSDIVGVLDKLHGDRTRYVTRSVANTLNDISKLDAPLLLETLHRWHQLDQQQPAELDWMTRHALRSLVKAGDPDAMEMLGYARNPRVDLTVTHATKRVKVGEDFSVAFKITSLKTQHLKIALRLHFQKANGQLSPKTFVVKDVKAKKNEELLFEKRQSFKPITTRVLHPGKHEADILVNGNVMANHTFELVV